MEPKETQGLVFLSDLSGFGRVVRDMDLLDLADVMKRFAEITSRCVAGGGGTIVKYLGDAALGYFPPDGTDKGVQALLKMKREIEADFVVNGKHVGIRVGAHHGPFLVCTLPPVERPDIHGETVNIAASLGSGGQTRHREQLILSPEAFRKLEPATRKIFHKFTEPIVYLAEK